MKRVPLNRLATCTLGKMVQSDQALDSDSRAEYLRAAHVQPEGRLIALPSQMMWFSRRELATLTLLRGDVVVVEGGAGYGRSAVLEESLPGWGFQKSIVRLRPRPGQADGRFLNYHLRAALHTGEIESLVSTATIPHFTAEKVSRLEVPDTPIHAQCAVSDYLDFETARIDAFIAKNEQLIALLIERRVAVISHAVTPAELMSSWERLEMRRLRPKARSGVSVNGESRPAEGDEVGVLRTGAVSKGKFDPADNKRVVDEDVHRVACQVRGDTLLVNRANTPDLVGTSAYVAESAPNLYLSDKIWELEFPATDARFIHYWTSTPSYRNALSSLAVGSSRSMQNLSYGDFLSLSISIPTLSDQREIVARLDASCARIDAAIATAREAIALAKERRAALISAAVTGQLDIPDAA